MVVGESAQVVEECLARLEGGAQHLIRLSSEVLNRVGQKGEQVEDEEHIGQVLFAMTKVVLQMVAMILEHISGPLRGHVVLVLNLPTRTASLGQGIHAVC